MTLSAKPFSRASENNSGPILQVLNNRLGSRDKVLEVGSGTGQHACYFSTRLPHLFWQTSDTISNHAGIDLWLDELENTNVGRPLTLDVGCTSNWSHILEDYPRFDAAYTANTAHIMSWQMVQEMFGGVSRILRPGGQFFIYGPFNRNGEFTSDSNHRFNQQLQIQDAQMGIRDDRAVITLANQCGLEFTEEFEMPANNRMMLFENAPK
jgi:SAM-dependent methyltransferase